MESKRARHFRFREALAILGAIERATPAPRHEGPNVMTSKTAKTSALAGLLLAGFASLPAIAGECPAGQAGTNELADRAIEPAGVTDTVLGSIDVAAEPVAIEGRLFRMRELVIAPGGVVPFHSHEDRPALIYVVKGEIVEHSSDCLVPIVHKAGETSREVHTVSHWWKNESAEPVVLISADLLHDPKDAGMM
jgi:quercetin dioxygenase-like cupin family protein